jgi:hypothetical protein
MQRMIHWESPHERNAYRLLDADCSVHSFSEQPLVIWFRLNGEKRPHYPDVLVILENGRKVLLEVKTKDDSQRQDVRLRTELLSATLPSHGFEYQLVIGEEMGRQPRLENALTMLNLGRAPITLAEEERMQQAFDMTPSISWGEITEGRMGKRGPNVAARGVLEGQISFDINSPLSASTQLFMGPATRSQIWES